MTGWTKEFHGARDFGWRRDDGLAYVGQRTNKFWMLYVQRGDALRQDSTEGYASAELAMADYDGRELVAA